MPTREENDGVHYRDKEFLYKNVHYDKGWYFYDEEGDLYGPFLTRTQTEVGLRMYIEQLLRGEAPTQLGQLPVIGDKQ